MLAKEASGGAVRLKRSGLYRLMPTFAAATLGRFRLPGGLAYHCRWLAG